MEVYCEASVAQCEARDPKGLYKRARSGEVKDFTGVSAPYEAPGEEGEEEGGVEVRVRSGEWEVGECVRVIVGFLEREGLLAKGEMQEGGLVEG